MKNRNLTKEELNNLIDSSRKFNNLMSGVIPALLLGLDSFVGSSENPSVVNSKKNSKHILNGMIIIYLFSLWDSCFPEKNMERKNKFVEDYFRPAEKQMYYAFRHIRDVSAHNVEGSRKGNRHKQDRMSHAEHLDAIMNSNQAINGLCIDKYKIDLSQSHAALDCQIFLKKMILILPGRISVGGCHGKIRSQNKTTIEI